MSSDNTDVISDSFGLSGLFGGYLFRERRQELTPLHIEEYSWKQKKLQMFALKPCSIFSLCR